MMNKVEICGVNTSTLPVISNEKMRILFEQMQQGNKLARTEIVSGNLRLVLSVIQKFNTRGENPDDLFQVGCIGLMKAVDNFDLSQNVRFSTYAVPMNTQKRKSKHRCDKLHDIADKLILQGALLQIIQ